MDTCSGATHLESVGPTCCRSGEPLLFLQLATALALQSQPLVAVEGFVTDDATAAPIHGARVELTDAKAWTVTDTLGYYVIRVSIGGTHRLRVLRLGYETQTLHVVLPALGIDGGPGLRVDIALRAAPALMPLVRVSALPVVRHADRATPFTDARGHGVRRLSAAQLKAHPVLAEADALAAFSGEPDVSVAPESPTAFHLRGGSSDQLRFLIDGVPFYNPAHSAGVFGALNPDVLDGVALHTGAHSSLFGGAMAGTIDAQTRRPDSAAIHARGGVSATALRLTFDGPVVPGRSAFVASVRRGAPSLFGGRPDRTRLTAAFSDWLVKSSTRLGSGKGTLTLLATAAKDRTAFSSQTEDDSAATLHPARHTFDWSGSTVAAMWDASLQGGTALSLNAWRAEFDGDATWLSATPLHMMSTRHTLGLQTTLVRERSTYDVRLGVDFQHDRAAYRVRDERADTAVAPASLAQGRETNVAIFGEYLARVGRWDLRQGARAALLASGPLLLEPHLSASLHATRTLTISGGLARAYQTVQSLRNPESPATAVFGADLPVLSSGSSPIGRSDEVTLGIEALAGERLRFALDGYSRYLTGLALVQPGDAVPFALGEPLTGAGRVWGIGTTVDFRGERLTGRVTAGLGQTQLRVTDASRAAADSQPYQPGFATTHTITAAAAFRVGEKTSVRSAVFGRWGRRTTLYDGALDWEGCDALDGGCEIAGSPGRSLGALSGARLPPYLRWDIGGRRSWSARLAGRVVALEAHMTLRNLLDRRNVWGYRAGGSTAPRPLILRPLSVLAAGLDFHY